jgi:hypothetical protein
MPLQSNVYYGAYSPFLVFMCQNILFKARGSFKTANSRYFDYFRSIPVLMKADLIHNGSLTVKCSEQNCGNLVKGSNGGILHLIINERETLEEEGGVSSLSVSRVQLKCDGTR